MQHKYEYTDGRIADPNYHKIPHYPIWIEALKVFLLFMGVCCALSYTAYFEIEQKGILYTIPFYVLPWLSTYIRRRLHSIFINLIISVVMLAYLALAPSILFILLGGIYTLGIMLYQTVRQLSKQTERKMGFLSLLLDMGILFAINMLLQFEQIEYETVLFVQSLACAALFLLYQHYTGIHDALADVTTEKENNFFSTKRVKQFNHRLFLGYLALFGLLLCIMYLLGSQALLSQIGDWLLWGGRHLTELFHSGGVAKETSELLQETVEGSAMDALQWMDIDRNLFLEILVKGIIIMYIVSGVISLSFYLIQADRTRKKEESDYEGQGYVETKEFYKDTKKKKKKQNLAEWLDYSPENRIRRAYYRRVKGEIGKKVRRSDTPCQVGEKLDDIRELANKYNEVRYKKS